MSTVDNGYDWKVTIIAQYTDSWLYEYNLLIQAITSHISTPKICFTIFKYYAQSNPDADCKAEIIQYNHTLPASGKTTELGNCNLYKEDTLKNFLANYVAPVNGRHILITWGHGAGLGYFPPPPANPVVNAKPEWFVEIFGPVPDKHPIIPPVNFSQYVQAIASMKANLSRSPVIDETKAKKHSTLVKLHDEVYIVKDHKALDNYLKVISAEQLASLLKPLGKPVDLFIACNCYCQMLEPGLALKDTVKIMVAAQTDYPITGFNYAPFFQAVQIDTTFDSIGLAKNICDKWKDKYTARYIQEIPCMDPEFITSIISSVSISANDLSGYEKLIPIINQLALWMTSNFEKTLPTGDHYYDAFYTARSFCKDLGISDGLIDLQHFTDELVFGLQDYPQAELNIFSQSFLAQKKSCLIDILKPPILYRNPSDLVASASPEFLSVFFPDESDKTNQKELYDLFYDLDSPGMPDIQKHLHWVDFVRKYYLHFRTSEISS